MNKQMIFWVLVLLVSSLGAINWGVVAYGGKNIFDTGNKVGTQTVGTLIALCGVLTFVHVLMWVGKSMRQS